MTLMAQGRQWVVQKDASGDIRRAVAGNPSTGQAVEAGVDKSAGVGGDLCFWEHAKDNAGRCRSG
ncbi:hypothetical protein BFX80_15620 [Cobetia marina]|nr:hypothetical protein BFX80_15620 [Cobetia marina]